VVVYRSPSIVAVLAPRTEKLEDALVLLRHVRALNSIAIELQAWPDWLARRGPTWGRSAHAADLELFATELQALQAAWPTAEAIASAGPVRRLLERVASEQAVESERARERDQAMLRENERVRAIAERLGERPPACPHCAAVRGDVRFIDGGELRNSYFICQECGSSFVPAPSS
jgi:hypothetical protein